MSRRTVTAHLEGEVIRDTDLAIAIAVSAAHERVEESLTLEVDGVELDPTEAAIETDGRLTMIRGVRPGMLAIDYQATVTSVPSPAPATEVEMFRYTRPSRYCESDRLAPLARAAFTGLSGPDLLAGVSSWVGANVAYVGGSSRPTDGAVSTLLAREGVCRDFAHLTTALLRANDVPARTVSVYAPGLSPMDFHAVAEACLDGQWYVVDPTCLAPRSAMVRIATGADASDTAFLTNLRGEFALTGMEVTAVVDGDLPTDDVTRLVQLG